MDIKEQNALFIKNKDIVLDYLSNEIEIGNKWMENHLKAKVSVIPMDLFFRLLIGPDIAIKMKKQVDLLLDCSIQYLENEKTEEILKQIVENNLKLYLIRDSMHQNLNKKHKSYEEAKLILKRIFIERIISEAQVLEGIGNTYNEISTDKLVIDESLSRYKIEKSLNEKLLEIIKNNRSIISIAGVFRADLIDAFLDFYDYLHKRLEENIIAAFKDVGKIS
ncbi:MAG: hypothetical protein EAX96_01310 [Candidatus Lokiarchaeota archaeon]|nr:hypothetical protein [Candidatus Lokiarchaeota archaeon]